MSCLELIKFDVSNNNNNNTILEVENDGLSQDVMQSWKMIVGGRGKSWKICRKKVKNPVHGSNGGPMPFLMLPVTFMVTSRN